MKVYYALAILVHLLAAFLSRDKNKSAFLLYLMKNLLINEKEDGKRSGHVLVLESDETTPSGVPDKYKFLSGS